MAQMFPSSPRSGCPLSERTVFEALQSGLPKEVLVLHGKRIISNPGADRPNQEGEADFLIIDPRHGCLVLEVKGGRRIFTRNGVWYTEDHFGEVHRLSQDVTERFKTGQV